MQAFPGSKFFELKAQRLSTLSAVMAVDLEELQKVVFEAGCLVSFQTLFVAKCKKRSLKFITMKS